MAVHTAFTVGPGHLEQHVAEEAFDHQPFGHLRWHASALEVEALLLVDRTDGRRVGAVHVVVVDLEVGHRLGPGVGDSLTMRLVW